METKEQNNFYFLDGFKKAASAVLSLFFVVQILSSSSFLIRLAAD